ncbi:MAG: hypothetical protein N3F07_01660 [Candidatus Micrarchaeota archaeon]|nr:hypothetical protein [Candidatus Micrarchaeota archaeon]
MPNSDFDIRLKRESRTSLQAYRDQSLLQRRFGDVAVKLYNLIDSGKTASELMAQLKISEEQFMQILEFMNNNAMVSVVQEAPQEGKAAARQAPPAGSGEPGGQEGEEGQEKPESPPAISPEKLSPLEKAIFEKYGEIGVRIYSMIDGEKTAEEILKQTGVSEAKLVEILEFMDQRGIIKLENPSEAKQQESPSGQSPETESQTEEPALEPRFKPLIEEEPEEKPFVPPKPPPKKPPEKEQKHEEEVPAEEIVMVDVPSINKLSIMQHALFFAELSTKFDKKAKSLMDSVDGQKDFIDLSLSTGLSLYEIDAIMAYFGKKGFLSFRQLSREEIKKKYGEDGFAIYKRFGRDGLLLYEMIGKEASLRDIIVKSKLDPDRAIDILIFIHKVLGLDIPIDRNVIYRQLGLKK